MPVEDINMAKTLDEFLNVIDATETTTGFLAENGETIGVFFVFIILMLLVIGFIYIFWHFFRKATKK